MKCKKACGSDGALHSSLEVILPATTLTLNYMLDMGNFPDSWIEGLIFPIHKSGDKKDPSNYRRITVLPSMGKLFKNLVNNRLVLMKDVFNMEDKFNGGFKNSSTSNNMFLLIGAIQRAEFLKQPLYVALLDFKRAFDTVNRNMLFYKLVKRKLMGIFVSYCMTCITKQSLKYVLAVYYLSCYMTLLELIRVDQIVQICLKVFSMILVITWTRNVGL